MKTQPVKGEGRREKGELFSLLPYLFSLVSITFSAT
jgi:hypothetical protein